MNKRGFWFVLAASVLWGTTGTTQALAPAGAQPVVIGTLRLMVGGLAMLVIAAFSGGFADIKSWSLRATLMSAVCVAAYQLFFFAGVARTGVAVGTIVGIGSSPIFGGILGYLFRGERPGWKWAAATLLAVVGCALLASAGEEIKVDALGMLLAVIAGAAYAGFSLFSKPLFEKHSREAVLAAAFCLGALLLLPNLPGKDLTWLAQPRGMWVALHLGLVTAAGAYSLYARGLSLVPVATAVTLTLAEPLTAGMLGVLLLGERLTLVAGAGIVLIFSGLVVLSLERESSPPVEEKAA